VSQHCLAFYLYRVIIFTFYQYSKRLIRELHALTTTYFASSLTQHAMTLITDLLHDDDENVEIWYPQIYFVFHNCSVTFKIREMMPPLDVMRQFSVY
jgi:hypothetical protein